MSKVKEVQGELVTVVNIEQKPTPGEAEAVCEIADGLVVSDGGTYAALIAVALEIKAHVKKIEEQHDAVVKPLKESLKAIKVLFDPPLKRYAKAEASIKDRLKEFRAKRSDQMDDLVEEGTDKSLAAAQALALPEVSGFSVRVLKRLRVTNEKKIPKKFLIVDEKAVLKALKDGEKVPGAEIVENESLALGGKK